MIQPNDITLVSNKKELQQCNTLLALATTTNREVIEGPINGITRIEQDTKKDKTHSRRAGLDQVNTNILAQKKAAYIVFYQDIKNSKQPATTIGRITQNIRTAQKTKLPIILLHSTKNPTTNHDLQAFWKSIDIPHTIINNNEKTIKEWYNTAQHRNSKEYVAEGIKKKTRAS